MIRLLLSFALCVLLIVPATAQSMMDWATVVERAERVLERGTASVESMTDLRDTLVGWRAQFEEEQDGNAARIATLQAQIDSLGPAPEDGAAEPEAIAEQRVDLTRRLDELLAPIRTAQAAFAEADGLIAETDRLVEAARAQALLTIEPAPINPVNWPPAIAALGGWFSGLWQELRAPFATATARAVWQRNGVQLGVLSFLAILLIWRSGVWLRRLRHRLIRGERDDALLRLALFGISLSRTVLPILGLFALTRILDLIGVMGLRGQVLTALLPLLGICVLVGRWLAIRVLPAREGAATFLPVALERRGEARLHAVTLGILLALTAAIEAIAETDSGVAQTRGVAHAILLAIAGVNLLRLGQLFLAEGRSAREVAEEDGFWAQVLRLTGRAIVAVGVVAPLVAAVGYVNLGMAILWPSVLTLALIALIGILQQLAFDVHAAIMRRADPAYDALTPTLVGFALTVAALPALALIWGVRPSTLGEWWAVFLRGFSLGETRISPENFLVFVVVFTIGYFAVRMLKGMLRTNVLPKTKLDSGGTNAILSGTGYVGITLAALIAITAAGINLGGLAIVAGALSVGIGFGLQTVVQNFVSGIILLIERPIKLGDWVQAGGVEGFVRQISVRSTRIETFDRQDVIVPNADLIAGVVTNFTLENSAGRVVIHIGVAYGSDTRRVQTILEEVAADHPMVLLNPGPLVTFDGFGADSLDFTVRVVLRDILFKVIVASEINHAIAERFAQEGLEIPFAQRDIWLRNPEALRTEGTRSASDQSTPNGASPLPEAP